MEIKLVFISYGRISKIIRSLENEYQPATSFTVYNTLRPVEIVLELQRKKVDCVLVSSGINVRTLQADSRVTLPLVEIKPTIHDILQAIGSAKAKGNNIAVITPKNNTPSFDKIKSLLNVDPPIIPVEEYAELPPIFERLKAQGITGIVGSSIVCEHAKQAGLGGFLIWSTSSVRVAIEQAIDLARANRQVTVNNRLLQEILQMTLTGIIYVDGDGIVQVFNPLAAATTGIPEEKALGKPLAEVLPSLSPQGSGVSSEPELDMITELNGHAVLLNRTPFASSETIYGVMFSFQSTKSVQKSEEKIRRKLYDNGFVAKTHFRDILGDSRVLSSVKGTAAKYAKTNSAVLICSETGTGKDLFAQSIHNASVRNMQPFVAVNCAAMPHNLMESELFGYEEGAFTGAKKGGKLGFFEIAHGGTLFLDEIGEVSLPIQSHLLRVLEHHEVMRVGGERMHRVDTRIITATNRNLWEMVQKKQFREDLYYRLNVLELHIPPLRDRREDIPLLTTQFLLEFRPDMAEAEIRRIAETLALLDYPWPGNIRELKNIIERLSVVYESGGDLEELLSGTLFMHHAPPARKQGDKTILERTLDACGGNRSRAALELGISRTTLWRRMQREGLG